MNRQESLLTTREKSRLPDGGTLNLKKKWIFFLFSNFSFLISVFSQNIYDTEHSFQYARHLVDDKKYELAAKEYERLLFFNPGNDSLVFLLSRTYIHNKQFEKALNIIEPKSSETAFSHSYLNLLLLTKQFDKTKLFSEKFSAQEQKKNLARTFLLMGNWKKIKDVDLQNFIDEDERNLFSEAQKFRRKKPIIALGLSVIPGLGKVYTGNYSDAAMSFLTVGVCAVLAYRGFDKKGFESIPGWIYGGLGAGLYLGNFYGGFKAAKLRNKKYHEQFINELEEIIITAN